MTWSVDGGEAAGRRLLVRWRETGGPPVQKSRKKGFGSELTERQVDYELEGEVEVEFAPGGLEATLAIPLTRELLELPSGT